MSSTDDNKRLVETFQQEVLHKGHYENAHQWAHDDLVIHLPPGMEPGLDNALRWFALCAQWFTSTGLDVDLMIAADDLVFQLITLHFEHTGEYMGIPPTGNAFSIGGLAAFRIRDGKIAEHWGLYDMQSVPAQLGAAAPSFTAA
jgi:steroid delta-isomerase-like uncharacterized protein